MTPSVFDDRQITVYSCTSADKQIDQKRLKKIFVIPPKYVTNIIGLKKVTFYVRDLWILSEWETYIVSQSWEDNLAKFAKPKVTLEL